MAKKKITSDGFDDLDQLMGELDDFDFDMEQEDSKIDMSNPREAAKKIAKSAGENFLKDIKKLDSAKLSHFAKKALPKEFQINEFSDLASSVKHEIPSGLSGIKQEASKTLKYFTKYTSNTTKQIKLKHISHSALGEIRICTKKQQIIFAGIYSSPERS